MNKKFTTSQITLLGLMIAILLLMAYTPSWVPEYRASCDHL